MLLALMLTVFGDKGNLNNSIDNGDNKEVVYYSDVETVKKCDNYEESNSNTGNTKGCIKWYLYSGNGNNTVNLILDHNITDPMSWNIEEDANNGPSASLLNALKEKTSNWTGINDRKDKYNFNNSNIKYTIDYKGYKARLISKEEIMNIINDT